MTQKLPRGDQTIATLSYLILLPTPELRSTSEHDASEGGSLSSEEGTFVRSWGSEEGCLPEMELGFETVVVVDGEGESPKRGEREWWEVSTTK